MKKIGAALLICALVVCLLSCDYKGTYDEGHADGYAEGYSDGYSDGEFDMQFIGDEEFSDGYAMGYEDGYHEVNRYIERASDYAWNQTGWSVYEAWSNISIYQDGIHPYGYDLPTEEEYLQSIETLVLFCEYLDNAGVID